MKRTINFFAAAVLVFGATAAFGQATMTGSASTGATNNVTAHVNAVCTIGNFTLAFGAYNPLNAVALDSAAATISVNCTSGIAPNIALTTGRTISNGTSSLTYQIFSDSTRSTELTSGTAVSMGTSDGTTALTYPLYGRIPALQNVTAGNYAGNLTATINW